MAAPCCRCLMSIITKDRRALDESVDRHVLDLFIRGVKNHFADPLVLSAALDGVCVCLGVFVFIEMRVLNIVRYIVCMCV